jgi:hypothetical protein
MLNTNTIGSDCVIPSTVIMGKNICIHNNVIISPDAILYNNIEEINSINKLLNIGLTAMRSNEYFHDLLIYKQYSYINFNNFKNYGFSFLPSGSINSIRYSNFEFKKNNTNNLLETRVISSDSRVNIIGVALPKYSIFNKSTILQCTRVKNTYNLDNIPKNSYKVFLKKIKQMLLNNNNNKIITYWIFNKNKDVFVEVQTGKVSVYTRKDQERSKQNLYNESIGVILTPNQKVAYSANEERLLKSIVDQPVALVNLPLKDFIFDEKPVSEVFYLLEKMYGITVIYDFNVMGNCYLTANLTDESLFKKLDLICKITHSTYEKTDAQIIIHSEGCLK